MLIARRAKIRTASKSIVSRNKASSALKIKIVLFSSKIKKYNSFKLRIAYSSAN